MEFLTLDLHGARHADVPSMVERLVNANWGSGKNIKIITGNSQKMKAIVTKTLALYNLHTQEGDVFGNNKSYLMTEEV